MSKIRHQSHELPEAAIASARYGLAVFTADDHLSHADATWEGIFQMVPGASNGISLAELARLAVDARIVDPGYLGGGDWCETLLTWWKHGGEAPFLVQLQTGCAVNLQCSTVGEEGRIIVAIEVLEDADKRPAVPRISGLNAETADKIYSMMEQIGAATHGLSSSGLTAEQSTWLDAICDAGEGVVSLIEPDRSSVAETDLRQVG